MRFLYALLFILSLSPNTSAQQNLVPNGNFEEFVACPQSTSLSTWCTGWSSYLSTSPDYFHACYTGAPNQAGVPSNFMGWQYAASGDGYMGGYASPLLTGGTQECITRAIIPMQQNMLYDVSMSVSVANKAGHTLNSIAIYFYDKGPTSYTTTGKPNITAQVKWKDSLVRDTQNWVRLTKTFLADSAYDNIAIGNLGDDPVQTATVNPASGGYYFYYDSIVVTLAKQFNITPDDTLLCTGDTIRVPYWVNSLAALYQANNIFTLQLSDASGSFASPVNIGTKLSNVSDTIVGVIPATTTTGTRYRIRMIASNTKDTTLINLYDISINNATGAATAPSSVCAGDNIQLDANSLSSATYSWTGPNGFNAVIKNPLIINAQQSHSGNYYSAITLSGCVVRDTFAILVKPSPVKPDANNNGPLCAGEQLNITSTTPTAGVSYSWTGPASYTAFVQNPVRMNSTVAMSGDYILTVTLNGCDKKDTTTVVIKAMPAATVLSSNSPICAGSTLQLSSTVSTTGVSYQWSGPNGFSAATHNANISNSTTAATGWYKLTLTLNGCVKKDSVMVTVNLMPAIPMPNYNSPICASEQLKLTTTTVPGATYSWTGPNGFTSNIQNATRNNISAADAGIYSVAATVGSCTSPAGSMTVNINPAPFVVINTAKDTVCKNNPVQFNALGNNAGGTPLYRWFVNGSQSGTGSIYNTTTLNDGDVIRCDMTESTKCSSPNIDASNDIQMTVLPWQQPSVSIIANPAGALKENEYVTFTATPVNGGSKPTYQWKRNGQNVQGATSNIWSANTLSDNDVVTVDMTSSYACPQLPVVTSNSITVRVMSGVDDIATDSKLFLYPNPNKGTFTLKGEIAIKGELQIEITNAVGQVVHRQTINTKNGMLDEVVEIPAAVTGIYLLRLTSGNGFVTAMRVTISKS